MSILPRDQQVRAVGAEVSAMKWYHMALEGGKLVQYGRNETRELDLPFKHYCYVESKSGGDVRDAITHKPLKKVEVDNPTGMGAYQKHSWEADVPYVRRVMLDKGWTIDDVPKCWLDIEVDDSNGIPDPEKDPIISIGMIFDTGERVWLSTGVMTERDMLVEAMARLTKQGMVITYNGGTDVWETRSFDIPYLATRYAKKLAKQDNKFAFDYQMRHCAFIDLYQVYKYETARTGNSISGGYGLDNVCRVELGRGKIGHNSRFSEMDLDKLERYNMNDVELLRDLDLKFGFSDMVISKAQITNLNLVLWTTKHKRHEVAPMIMMDQLILKYSRRMGLAWPTKQYVKQGEGYEGALIMEPTVGRHVGVQNVDVKQMYPSIIINEKISPDKDRAVVPAVLKDLKKIRAGYKAAYDKSKSKEDYITQYSYKVLANLVYGGYGNESSRYYDLDLANAVTTKGRYLLQDLKRICEDSGFPVVYGDTDSAFVLIPQVKVDALVRMINRQIAPYEVEAGEYYESILFSGTDTRGTKKRYAGLHGEGEMKIVGLESIKRDYCQLSRNTQRWALEYLLKGGNIAEVQQYLMNTLKEMVTGIHDKDLILTKGVKPLDQYDYKKKGGKGLPHYRAAVMAEQMGHKPQYDISYVFTKQDVAPVLDGRIPPDIDYELYYKRQIRGVVEPLITAIQIQDGTYRKTKPRKTVCHNLFGFMSS